MELQLWTRLHRWQSSLTVLADFVMSSQVDLTSSRSDIIKGATPYSVLKGGFERVIGLCRTEPCRSVPIREITSADVITSSQCRAAGSRARGRLRLTAANSVWRFIIFPDSSSRPTHTAFS